LEAASGLIVITGCAHPRIKRILSLIKEHFKQDIALAMGGFHMAGFAKQEIKAIITAFRDLGVKKVGPCHCSGDETRKYFAEEYKTDYLQIGVGTKVKIR
jgi:7,8-dihydropterin-6-yl-methyl-4-(beta-D-ribofuranosyl)aminobenzene 5'-phosphate synthase